MRKVLVGARLRLGLRRGCGVWSAFVPLRHFGATNFAGRNLEQVKGIEPLRIGRVFKSHSACLWAV